MIECHILPSLLRNEVFWKGIRFSPPSHEETNESLEYADVIDAYTAINGSGRSFRFTNVTVKGGFHGVKLENIKKSLTISDSVITDTIKMGLNITSHHLPVVIQRTTIRNTTMGPGMVYTEFAETTDLCTFSSGPSAYPLALKASANSTGIECSKVC